MNDRRAVLVAALDADEGTHAIKWTRLSCVTFRANAVRLQLHALDYHLATFLRTLALPGEGSSGGH